MGQLVRDHVGDTLELGAGRLVLVDEERGVAEGDAAQVLHRTGGEVRNGDEVDLVAGVGDVEVLGEEAQGERADLQRELGQGELPRACTRPGAARRPRRRSRSISSLPTTKATRYVDIFMVGAKRMRCLSPTWSIADDG